MPSLLLLGLGGVAAYLLLSPSSGSGSGSGLFYTPSRGVAASDSPTTPGYCIVGTNQYGQNALSSGNGCFVEAMSQQQLPYSLASTPSVGDAVTADVWYQGSSSGFSIEGSVNSIDAMGNVTARVTALSANPSMFGESINIGDSITLPQGYWTQGSFGPATQTWPWQPPLPTTGQTNPGSGTTMGQGGSGWPLGPTTGVPLIVRRTR